MKHKIAGTKHKDRQQRIATEQGKKAKPRDKDDSPSSPTSPRSSRPQSTACLPRAGTWHPQSPRSQRGASDPIGARVNSKHNHRFQPPPTLLNGRKVADRSVHRKKKRKQAAKRKANEERHSNPRSSFRLHKHALEKPRTKRQRGGTVTADLQRGRAKSDRSGSNSERREDLQTKSDGGSLMDNH